MSLSPACLCVPWLEIFCTQFAVFSLTWGIFHSISGLFPDLIFISLRSPTFPWLVEFLTEFPDFSLISLPFDSILVLFPDLRRYFLLSFPTFPYPLIPLPNPDLRYFSHNSTTFPWPEIIFTQFPDSSLIWNSFHLIPRLFLNLRYISLFFFIQFPDFSLTWVIFTQFPDFSLTWGIICSIPQLFPDLRHYLLNASTFPWLEEFFAQFPNFSLTWGIICSIPRLFPDLRIFLLNSPTFPWLEELFAQFPDISLTWGIFCSIPRLFPDLNDFSKKIHVISLIFSFVTSRPFATQSGSRPLVWEPLI